VRSCDLGLASIWHIVTFCFIVCLINTLTYLLTVDFVMVVARHDEFRNAIGKSKGHG